MRLPLLLACLPLAACSPQGETVVANAVTNSIGEPAPAVTPTPSPTPSPVAETRANTRYRCIDGSKIAVAFDPGHGTATVSRAGKRLATLKQQRVASGISYKSGAYELSGKGDAMTFATPGQPPLPCTAIH